MSEVEVGKVLEAHLKVDSAVKTRLRKAENFMLKARTFEDEKGSGLRVRRRFFVIQ